ncbi:MULTISPECIES: TusE/DsrC/DsvC family sulfur relay protein [unclassified Halomonas]|uniref:TusE/DsrC/DsvC family sulfur relay protein n=1 Tax=unclassified Halomonas TaxID=2609666 RepID=UPI00209E55C5|nr:MULTISPECIES: TusE/DsrC/DsvC family sulfur relay protein [unclassified Halomonas]MCP1314051.1 TusE/DsrC/DsvC family sulfur relay protein [Halomonas sp. 707D7]MCP1325932.1 TusE/DsrC/DsvC family sulfur relay protein [Halomonas sp. 707D4]
MNDTSLYRYLDAEENIELDPEGYLVNMTDWSPEVAERLAQEEGLTLTEAHWEVLRVARDFYARFEMAPAMRALVKATRLALGDEKGSSIYLMGLFPESPARRVARLGGLPKPTNCL